MVKRSVFDKIFKEMQYIRGKLEELENRVANLSIQPIKVTESDVTMLPDHLRKTYLVILRKENLSAKQVSNLTKRTRALESAYLNQLVRMGWLNKYKNSRETLFCSPIEEKTIVSNKENILGFNGLYLEQ